MCPSNLIVNLFRISIVGKGLGVLVTSEIDPGEAVMVSKALVRILGTVGTAVSTSALAGELTNAQISASDRCRLEGVQCMLKCR